MVDLMTYRARIGTFAGVKALPGVLKRRKSMMQKLKRKRQPIKDLNLKMLLWLGATFLLVSVCASSYRRPTDHSTDVTRTHAENAVIGAVSTGQSLVLGMNHSTKISDDDHLGKSMIKWKADVVSYTLPDLSLVLVPDLARITQLDIVFVPSMTRLTHLYSSSAPTMTDTTHLDVPIVSRLARITHVQSTRLAAMTKVSQFHYLRKPAIEMFAHLDSPLSTVIKVIKVMQFPNTMGNHTFIKSSHTLTTIRRARIERSDLLIAQNLLYMKSSTLQTMARSTFWNIFNLKTNLRALYSLFAFTTATCKSCNILPSVIRTEAEPVHHLSFLSAIDTLVLNSPVMTLIQLYASVLPSVSRLSYLDTPPISDMVAGSGTCDYLIGNRGSHSYNGNPGKEGSPASSNNRKEIDSKEDNVIITDAFNTVVICKCCRWSEFTRYLLLPDSLSIVDGGNSKLLIWLSGRSQFRAVFSKHGTENGTIYLTSCEDEVGNLNLSVGVNEDNVFTLLFEMVENWDPRVTLPEDSTEQTLPLQQRFKFHTEKGKRFTLKCKKICTCDISSKEIWIANIISMKSRTGKPVDSTVSLNGHLDCCSTSPETSHQCQSETKVAQSDLNRLFDVTGTTIIMEPHSNGQQNFKFEIFLLPTSLMILDDQIVTRFGKDGQDRAMVQDVYPRMVKDRVRCTSETTINQASNYATHNPNCCKLECYFSHDEETDFSLHCLQDGDQGYVSSDEAICLNLDCNHHDVDNCNSNRKCSEKSNDRDIVNTSNDQNLVENSSSRNFTMNVTFACIIFIYLEAFKSKITKILMHPVYELRKVSKLLKKNNLPASTLRAKEIVELLSLPKHKMNEYLPCPDTNTVIAYPLGADLVSFMANTGKSKEQMLDNQWIRLSTFTGFPSSSPVSTLRLSDAGFYYENVGTDEVICFKCGVKYKGWKKGDVPVLIHKSISPSCEFIKNKSAPSLNEFGGDYSSTVQQRSDNVIPVTEPEASNSATGASGGPDDLQQLPSSLQAVELQSSSTPPRDKSDIQMSRPVTAGTKPPEVNANHAPNPANFAFTPQNSATGNEMSGSNAQSYSGNSSGNTRVPAPAADVLSSAKSAAADTAPKSKYPMYALYASRLQSYTGFPKDLNQKPDDLSKAGFFYEGKNDNVRCFYCGGGLRDWEPEDDPWIEHARWYKNCGYLRKNKGDEFVRLVHNGQYELMRREREQKKEEEKKKTEVMQLPAVVSVIEMGYSENLVKQAYDRCTSENGNTNVTADVLLQKVWQLEEEGQNNLDTANEVTNVERERSSLEATEDPSRQASAEEPNAQATSESSQSKPETLEELEQENKTLKEQQMCKICMEEEVAIVFLPCGHMVTCVSCAAAMRHCPLCRTFIRGTIKAIVC